MAITRLWKAGFETGNLLEFSATVSSSNSITASTTEKRTGSYSVRITDSAVNTYGYYNMGSLAQGRTGFHVRPQWGFLSGAGREPNFVSFWNDTTQVFALRTHYQSSNVFLFINGSEYATSAPMSISTWQHWGVDYLIDGNNGWVNFYIDGVLALSYADDTGSTIPNRIRFGPHGSNTAYAADVYFDDIYLDSTAGELAPAVVPDARFILYPLTSDFSTEYTPSTGTTHYTLVDEIPAVGTDYISATAADLEDTFGVTQPTLPLGFETVAIWPTATAFKSNAAVATTLTLMIDDGGVQSYGTAQDLPTTAGIITERFTTQPSGAVWANGVVTSRYYGVKSSGAF